jgi:hypothetical protein
MTNALAYYETEVITRVKNFAALAPGTDNYV